MATSDCYARALRLLAGRSHFRRQLEHKLLVRGYEDEDVSLTLERLEEERYLDDGQTAREFIESRLRRGPMGRRRMRAELERRGAAAEAAEGALDEAFSGRDELAATRDAAGRWMNRQVPDRGPVDLAALARHLDRLGFQTASVLGVVDEIRSRPGPGEGR